MDTTTTQHDDDLLEAAQGGDTDALAALIERHLHPAWRIATVAGADPAVAEAAVVEGFCDGLAAAHRQPDPSRPLRLRIVASTRRAAALAAAEQGVKPEGHRDPVIAAFLALPEKSRTAVWLTEVEGGTPDQVAPVLGLDRSAAASLAARSGAGLRDRLATDLATQATEDGCRTALSRLPAHAAGKLTTAERRRVSEHIGSCGSCAAWLAAVVSPRPVLRRIVAPPPAALAGAITARWLELLERERRGWLTPFTQRAIGAAAAATIAIGLGGVALLSGRDRNNDRAEVALPAGSLDDGLAGGESALGSGLPLPSASSGLTSGANTTAAAARGTTSTTSAPRVTTGPTTTTPTTSTPTTAPPDDDTTPPPSIEDPGPLPDVPLPEVPLPPLPVPEGTQVGVNIEGTASLGVGECTGAEVLDERLGCEQPDDTGTVTVAVPGLPPIGL